MHTHPTAFLHQEANPHPHRISRHALLALALLAAMLLLAACRRTPATVAPGGPTDGCFSVVTWNVGLDDADTRTIAAQLAAIDGVDLWLIQEARTNDAPRALEAAAELGQDANFRYVAGATGGDVRLLTLYNANRFRRLDAFEVDAIDTTGSARASLVLHLRDRISDVEFLLMNNHLYRSRTGERHLQAALLNAWVQLQPLPVLAGGDYNFDWEAIGGEAKHDRGYDLLTANGLWEWERPKVLLPTQCTDTWPCSYQSVLDFIFTAGDARAWWIETEILVRPGDFPDTPRTSDHRPVRAEVCPLLPEEGPTGALVAASTPAVRIVAVHADGAIDPKEPDEYATIANAGAAPVDLSHWWLSADDPMQYYVFPPGTLLDPGRMLRVYTNEIHPESGGHSFASREPVWANSGETGRLYDARGRLVHEFTYSK